MGAYLRADTDTLLMASVEKDSEAETEPVAAKSGKEMSSKERDAETEAQDLKQLASEALKAMQNKTVMSADSMSKSPSTEILENYNQQPLHVRSRAEQWELPRSVISKFLKFLSELDLCCGSVLWKCNIVLAPPFIRKSSSQISSEKAMAVLFIMLIGEAWMWLPKCLKRTLIGKLWSPLIFCVYPSTSV